MDHEKLLKIGPSKARISDNLRFALEEMIINGELKPGAKIDESALAEKFRVSRTPMRSAINALEAIGLLETKQRQGVYVAQVSVPELLEMFDTMGMMESLCAKYAARRATNDDVERLQAIQLRLERALENEDPELFFAINNEFHDALYDISHTQFIREQTSLLRRRISIYRKQVTYLPNRMKATIGEHAQIIEAIRTKQPELAMQAASDHVVLLGEDLVDFIAKLPHCH